MIRSLYRWLGRRYVDVALSVCVGVFYVLWIVGLVALGSYVEITARQYVRLFAVMFVVQTAYAAYIHWFVRRLLAPVRRWIEGARDADTTTAAWTAAATAPRDYLRELNRHVLPLTGAAVYAAFAAWELNLGVSDVVILLAAIYVLMVYGITVAYLAMEVAMRPVLDDLAPLLAAGVMPEARGLTLRMRLLLTLAALNVSTGVTVGHFAPKGSMEFVDLGVIILIALAAALTGALLVSVLLADSIVTPVGRLRQAAEGVAEGELSTRVLVTTTDETGELSRAFNSMAAGLEERERLRQAFGTFVDPALAERVLREGTDLAGEEVDVSVLFLDVRGFTSLSERTSAREVVAVLNDLYDNVVPIVLRHGGHANKFIGDGMLAVFGAPERLSDHADRAVAAAIDIAAAVRDRYRGELRVGVGVNSGRVLVGTVGGGGRLDFTVIGDAVNTAARIESATRATGDDVLISETTLARLADDQDGFDARPPLPLKGKREPVALYAPKA